MFIFYIRTKHLSPVALKLEAKDSRVATMLFYILQKNYLSRSCIFFEDLSETSIQNQILSGGSIASASQFGKHAMLLLTVGN
jgi:hypothetical protein